MGMVQHDRWFESKDDPAHLIASFPTISAWFLTCPAPRTEQIKIMATKNEYALICEFQEVRAKVGHLYEITFLVARRVGLASPEDTLAGDFVYCYQLGMFLMSLMFFRNKINPDRQDIDLSRGSFQDAVSDGTRERCICVLLKLVQVGRFGIPANPARPLGREVTNDEPSGRDQKLQLQSFWPPLRQHIEQHRFSLVRIARLALNNYPADQRCSSSGLGGVGNLTSPAFYASLL